MVQPRWQINQSAAWASRQHASQPVNAQFSLVLLKRPPCSFRFASSSRCTHVCLHCTHAHARVRSSAHIATQTNKHIKKGRIQLPSWLGVVHEGSSICRQQPQVQHPAGHPSARERPELWRIRCYKQQQLLLPPATLKINSEAPTAASQRYIQAHQGPHSRGPA